MVKQQTFKWNRKDTCMTVVLTADAGKMVSPRFVAKAINATTKLMESVAKDAGIKPNILLVEAAVIGDKVSPTFMHGSEK